MILGGGPHCLVSALLIGVNNWIFIFQTAFVRMLELLLERFNEAGIKLLNQ